MFTSRKRIRFVSFRRGQKKEKIDVRPKHFVVQTNLTNRKMFTKCKHRTGEHENEGRISTRPGVFVTSQSAIRYLFNFYSKIKRSDLRHRHHQHRRRHREVRRYQKRHETVELILY